MRINTKERLGNKASTRVTTVRVCVLTYVQHMYGICACTVHVLHVLVD